MDIECPIICNTSYPQDFIARLSDMNFLKELHEQTKLLIEKQTSSLKYADVNQLLNKQIQIEKQVVDAQGGAKGKGRGGNNIAQNIKKSFLAIIKKKLSLKVNEEFQQRFVKPYNLKSQKQNIVLFFMFLYVLAKEQKITLKDIEIIRIELTGKIDKYMMNSEKRLGCEEWRKDFHMKNIAQFEKFKTLDLDFSRQRKYQEIVQQISRFYLRKKMEYQKSQDKVRKIIQSLPELCDLFLDPPKKEILQHQSTSQSTPIFNQDNNPQSETEQ